MQERLLEPLGLARTTWGPAEPAARPYFVEPYSDAARREPELELGGKGGESGLSSTVGDLARWGAFLADPDEAVLAPTSVDEMHSLQIMAEPDWTLGWGLGVALWRRGERIFGGHTGGFPGFLSMSLYSRRERVGAVVLTNSGNWPKLSETGLALAEAALDELPPDVESWAPEEPPPEEMVPLLGRWWSEGDETIFSWRHGKLKRGSRRRRPSVSRRSSSRRERIGSAPSPVASAARCFGSCGTSPAACSKLYWATYPFTRSPETSALRVGAPEYGSPGLLPEASVSSVGARVCDELCRERDLCSAVAGDVEARRHSHVDGNEEESLPATPSAVGEQHRDE